jgi:hypothetical protein
MVYRFSVLCPALLIECKASCLVMLNRLMRYISNALPVSSWLLSDIILVLVFVHNETFKEKVFLVSFLA